MLWVITTIQCRCVSERTRGVYGKLICLQFCYILLSGTQLYMGKAYSILFTHIPKTCCHTVRVYTQVTYYVDSIHTHTYMVLCYYITYLTTGLERFPYAPFRGVIPYMVLKTSKTQQHGRLVLPSHIHTFPVVMLIP